MAWIKLETHTFDKVEVFSMAQELGIDPDSVVGKCARVWAWFDANTTDGVTKSVTTALLDRYCGVTGFSKAMVNVGWMVLEGGNLYLPNYDRHNSQTAKDRALGAKRAAKHKKNKDLGIVKSNAVTNDEPLAKSKIEKIREDKNIHTPDGVSESIFKDYLEVRKTKKAKWTDTALKGLQREASKANISLEKAMQICCERNWVGIKAEWLKDEVQQVEKVKFI
jgi:hypothetical protein